MKTITREYRRHLPHIQPAFGTFFITFRLAGSLPTHVLQKMREEQEILIDRYKKVTDIFKQNLLIQQVREEYFTNFDALLDSNKAGPHWLSDGKIAGIVCQAIHYRDNRQYELICYCIMSNHVHLIIQTIVEDIPLYNILGSLKQYSATQSNIILDRKDAFWQHESYDHLIRDRNELVRMIDYTLNNPVKAGLVDEWKQWKYSYVKNGYK